MFFNFKECLTKCFCTLKEIYLGSHEFSRNQKVVTEMVFHDLWALNWKIVIHGIWNPRAWNGLKRPVTLILTPFCFITFPFRPGFSYMQVGIWVSLECPVSKKMIFITSWFKKVLLTWKLRWTLRRQIVAVANCFMYMGELNLCLHNRILLLQQVAQFQLDLTLPWAVQLVARIVLKEWTVPGASCSNMSPRVSQSLYFPSLTLNTAKSFLLYN